MKNTVKFFASEAGRLVSNGVTKVTFVRELHVTSNRFEIDLLKGSQSVHELTEEEAKERFPDLFNEESENNIVDANVNRDTETKLDSENNEGDGPDGLSKGELKEMALELGIDEATVKSASKADLRKLIVKKQEELAA